jgi:hypothetical protein
MPETIETTVYQFDELSDAAKERARDWWKESRDESDFDAVLEDFGRICDLIGITLDTHPVQLMSGKTRYDPKIWYQVGYCQSDFAAFEGNYRYRTQAAKKLKQYAPQDAKLAAIVDALQEVQKRNSYGLRATVTHHHYYGLQVETEHTAGREISDEDHETVKEAMRDLASWLYDTLRKEDEYQTEDEQVDENIRANEYTFTETGRRFG